MPLLKADHLLRKSYYAVFDTIFALGCRNLKTSTRYFTSSRLVLDKTVSVKGSVLPGRDAKRSFAPLTSSQPNQGEISNRQKFKQLDPPLRLYEKLERLGFGTLRRTKRYESVRQQKTKDKHTVPDPDYKLPLLSFYAGAKTPTSFPSENLGEVAFVGRSNVGKSSLLNSLASTTIVRTSDKPGLTQQINFFSVGRLFYMVDMPGYGFAFVEDEQRKQWRELMETYITERKSLKRVFVVIDARHGLKAADIDFLNMLDRKHVKFQIVMTKCDIPVLPTLARRIMVVENDLKQFRRAVQSVLVVSSKTGAGINQMRKEMLFIMGHLKENEFYKGLNKK